MSTSAEKLVCLLAVCTLCVVTAMGRHLGRCGGDLSARNGSIKFRREQIHTDLRCKWRIKVPGATSYNLTFVHLALASRKKWGCKAQLMIAAWNKMERAFVQIQGSYRLCGTGDVLPSMEVQGDAIEIHLAGLHKSLSHGFTLEYNAVVPAPTPELTGPVYPGLPGSLLGPGDFPSVVMDAAGIRADTRDPCQQLGTSSLGRADCQGRWIVVQRRTRGDQAFDLPWSAYQRGFGTLAGDYWLGLDALNELCPPRNPCQLKVEITYKGEPPQWGEKKLGSGRYVAEYGRFAVGPVWDFYRLTVGDYDESSSSAGDRLGWHTDMAFSTRDQDNDAVDAYSCSNRYGASGGWWYNRCHQSNLNGEWGAWGGKGLVWWTVTGPDSASASRMLVRVQ